MGEAIDKITEEIKCTSLMLASERGVQHEWCSDALCSDGHHLGDGHQGVGVSQTVCEWFRVVTSAEGNSGSEIEQGVCYGITVWL